MWCCLQNFSCLKNKSGSCDSCSGCSCNFYIIYRVLSNNSSSPMRRTFIIGIMMLAFKHCFSFTMQTAKNRCNFFRLNVASLPSDSAKFALPAITLKSVERELNRALDFARLMDRQHGLCTEPSRSAWSQVDAIYEKMEQMQQAFRTYPSTKSAEEQHPGQKSKRKIQKNEPIQDQAVYFF